MNTYPKAAAALTVFLLAACTHPANNTTVGSTASTTTICLDPSIADPAARALDAQNKALIALFNAHEGDTIQFCEGQFSFTSSLTLSGKRGITIQGAGMNKTYLRFNNSNDQDGFNLNRMTGITIQGLTIYDAPGNGLRIFRSDYVTIRDVKVGWSVSDPPEMNNPFGDYAAPTPSPDGSYQTAPAAWTSNGSYAFYPVLCHHVLIEDSISVGSSDAGVYVGQSSDILVQRTEAYHNVAGFEFENTYRAEFVDNYAHDNVGGFLVFDLPGRSQYGEKNLVHDNLSKNNNLSSFAPRGAIVGDVPSGTGMLVLASDQLELYRNQVTQNRTVGLAIVNYGLVSTTEGDRKYDFFPEGIHIHDNAFDDNAGNPQLPDNSRNGCQGLPASATPVAPPVSTAGVPGSTNDLNSIESGNPCVANNATLLVTIIEAKNSGKSAQIVWDGGIDSPDDACKDPPTDHNGVPLTQPTTLAEPERYEARYDERGRPNYYIFDNAPVCNSTDGKHHTYNKWKFKDAATAPTLPDNGMCLENNTFTQSTTNPADPFVNVHFATADPTVSSNQTPADHTQPSNCPMFQPPLLTQFPPRLGSFVANPAEDPRPSDAQLAAVCGAVQPGQINYPALLAYNCPRLDQYGLFTDPADPTKNPTGNASVPFDLNTALFSDYAVKSRFLFLPRAADGTITKATYVDVNNCHDHGVIGIFGCDTSTLGFPVGTVFAKTFAFRSAGTPDNVVETRLLINRPTANGGSQWVGMAYLWNDHCADGTRCAELKIEGATASVAYDYDDPDSTVVDGNGARVHYGPGTVAKYGIPNAGNCLLCHGGDDRDPGAAPIGPKARNLNKLHDYGDGKGPVNQLQHWSDLGLIDLPATVEAGLAKWNVANSGNATDVAKDKHLRARAFLEVNCMHCHNPAGAAQNSGLSLDARDAIMGWPMGEGHGICKPPIAAGKAADNAFYDIVPTDPSTSLLFQRLSSTTPGIKMPPLARTVVQSEAVSLISDWMKNVVDGFADPNADSCKPSATPLPADMVPLSMVPLP